MRGMLLLILVLGITGTGAELLLVGHFEDPWQLVPLVLFALALIVVVWHAARREPASVRVLQMVMGLFVLSGVAGVYLHYGGNVEFERELDPGRSGFELFKEAMSGATPVLAPGTMVLLGLIGLVYTHQHPALATRGEGLDT
jgi:hypothetical protein